MSAWKPADGELVTMYCADCDQREDGDRIFNTLGRPNGIRYVHYTSSEALEHRLSMHSNGGAPASGMLW